MSNRKSQYVCLIIATIFFSLAISSAALAASSAYAFDMSKLAVDGSENGKFHTLKSGKIYIKGSMYQTEQESLGWTERVSYELRRKSWLSYKSFGTISRNTISGGPNHAVTVSGSYTGDINSSSYYLYVYKPSQGIRVVGSGTLSN